MVQGVNFSSFSSGANFPNKDDIEAKLLALGIPKEIIQQGPAIVKEYADAKNITLPPPPVPPNVAGQGSVNGLAAVQKAPPHEDFKQKLISLGIPENIVAEGKAAVTQYAQKNNIELPAPPEPPEWLDMNAVIGI